MRKHRYLTWQSQLFKTAFIYFDGSSLKVMRNVFYFKLKNFFVLEIFTFLSWHFGYVEKRLDQKAMVNFKIYVITLHILPNISRSKGNQKIKLCQFIEYNMRNICLENSFAKCGVEASPKPVYKILKLSISLDQQSEIL